MIVSSTGVPLTPEIPLSTARPDGSWVTLSVMLVDAIAGAGFPSAAFAERCVQQGVAEHTFGESGDFTGTVWLKAALFEAMPEEELQLLYMSIKNYTSYTSTTPGA